MTSVVHDDAGPDTIDMVAVTGDGAWSVTTPLLPRTFTGAGDLTAATFLAQLLQRRRCRARWRVRPPSSSACSTSPSIRPSELPLVAAQDEIVHPTARFEAPGSAERQLDDSRAYGASRLSRRTRRVRPTLAAVSARAR